MRKQKAKRYIESSGIEAIQFYTRKNRSTLKDCLTFCNGKLKLVEKIKRWELECEDAYKLIKEGEYIIKNEAGTFNIYTQKQFKSVFKEYKFEDPYIDKGRKVTQLGTSLLSFIQRYKSKLFNNERKKLIKWGWYSLTQLCRCNKKQRQCRVCNNTGIKLTRHGSSLLDFIKQHREEIMR